MSLPRISPVKSITCGLSQSGSGKKSEDGGEAVGAFQKRRWEVIPDEVKQGRIPGYQGFIRGQQHFYGSTYGRMSRSSSHHTFGPNDLGNPVDEIPKVDVMEPVDSQAKKYRLPGYAGYVPSNKFEFAQTFGRGTDRLVRSHESQMDSYQKNYPRMLTTQTTEMLNGRNTVMLEREHDKVLTCDMKADMLARKGKLAEENIPGYAGFVRGSQHFFGSTYGSMTRCATAHDFRSPVVKNLPPPPNNVDDPDDMPFDRPPGYGGHVPLAKFEYSRTFGTTCGECVNNFKETRNAGSTTGSLGTSTKRS